MAFNEHEHEIHYVDTEFSRTAVAVIRNALRELCNSTAFPPSDPELSTIVGFERPEIQEMVELLNEALSSREHGETAGGFVRSVSPSGRELTLRCDSDTLRMFRAALFQAETACADSFRNERGGWFDGSEKPEADQVIADFERRMGATRGEVKALAQSLLDRGSD